MGTYIIRDVQNFLIERWRRKQMDHEPTLDDVYSSKITRLREQNRVLVRYLEQARDSAKQVHNMAMKNVRPNPDTITMENVAINHLEFVDRLLRAALTATRQPSAADVHQHMFDHGDATSQEGQHG